MPVSASVGREAPDQPQMREVLQTFKRTWITVIIIKNDPASQTGGKTALSRNTEFLGELSPYYCYRSDFHRLPAKFFLGIFERKSEILLIR